jgi:ABC-2 type transport system permease protein
MIGTGTVFDIGYQEYTGAREGRKRALQAVYKDGIRTALGLGRGPRAKALPWFFLAVLSMVGLVMAIIAGAANSLGGQGTAEKMNLPTHSDFYGIASMILFVFASVVAPELLCRDRREGVINLYLVRPLTGSDYVSARWLAFLTIMLIATWLPQTVLFMGLIGGDPHPAKYLQTHWLDIPRYLAAGLVMSAYVTTIAFLVASFTTRRAYAAVFLVGLFAITTPFTVGAAEEMKGPLGQLISMFSLTNIPLHVSDLIFGTTSEPTKEAPARTLGPAILTSWYLAWTFVPGAVVWFRYRRLTP